LFRQQRRYLHPWGCSWDDSAVEERGPKQGKVTEENVREASRLKAIWEETASRRAEDGAGTQAAFGEKYGIGSQGAVGFFLNGETALSLKAAVGFAVGMYCRVADFSPRLADQLFHFDRRNVLSMEVLDKMGEADATTIRRIENAIRSHLDMEALPPMSAGPSPAGTKGAARGSANPKAA
jgi:hypothetical protein